MSQNTFAFFLLILFLTFSFKSKGQALDEISLKKGVKVSGGISLVQNIYYTDIQPQIQAPYLAVLSGNVSINIFGYSVPLSFMYSNSTVSYAQPFNRLSFTPTYKKLKAYIGYTSMNFSKYTLSGHSFYGLGAEFSPGKWTFAAMTGRLKDAVEGPSDRAVYKRMGYGMKLGYKLPNGVVETNIMMAKDDTSSLVNKPIDGRLLPKQNIAISLLIKQTIAKSWVFDFEYAVSALERNLGSRIADTSLQAVASYNLAGKILKGSNTTQFYDAFNGGFGYQAKSFGLMMRYERVAPDYISLGSYGTTNDFENITLAPNLNLLKGKLNLSGNVGIQNNNLNGLLASKTTRTVGAVNANMALSAKMNLNFSFNNMTNFSKMRPVDDPFTRKVLDSLDFYMINKGITGTFSWMLGSKEKPQNFMLTGAYQESNQNSKYIKAEDQLSTFLSFNTSYSFSIPKPNITLVLAANANISNSTTMKVVYLGPSLIASTSLFQKKIRCSLSQTYNYNSINQNATGGVLSSNLSMGYVPKVEAPIGKEKKTKTEHKAQHSINANLSFTQKLASGLQSGSKAIMLNISYSLSFQ